MTETVVQDEGKNDHRVQFIVSKEKMFAGAKDGSGV